MAPFVVFGPGGDPEPAEVLVVPYVAVACPSCASKAERQTYGRDGAKRYHRCLSCGVKFVSVEIPASQVRHHLFPNE